MQNTHLAAPYESSSLATPPIQGALWVLGSDVNLSLWQQRRENHTTGLRPEENKQTSLRSRKCTPFGASAPPFPWRGNFALRSAFGPISILRHNAAKTSPSGGGAVGRRGAFPRAAGAVLRFSLPMAALPPTGGNNTHRREAAIPPPSAAEGGCRPLSEANTTLLHNPRRSRTPSPSEPFEPSEPSEPEPQSGSNGDTTTLGPKGRRPLLHNPPPQAAITSSPAGAGRLPL